MKAHSDLAESVPRGNLCVTTPIDIRSDAGSPFGLPRGLAVSFQGVEPAMIDQLEGELELESSVRSCVEATGRRQGSLDDGPAIQLRAVAGETKRLRAIDASPSDRLATRRAPGPGPLAFQLPTRKANPLIRRHLQLF